MEQLGKWALPSKGAFGVVDIYIELAFCLCHRLFDMVR